MSGQVCFPEPRSQHSKSAIGNGTIARLHLFRTIFFRRHEHGNQFSGGAQSRPQQSAPAAPSNEPPMDFDDDIPF